MIAFALIFVSCVPMTAELIREFRYLLPWASAREDFRRRFLRKVGMTVLCYAALIELGVRFAL